jgi:hypothetical protein
MPTESELQQGARFIRYEYLMLAEACRRWTDHGLSDYSRTNKWERRLVTDVFLLHSRNLLDFLSPRKHHRAQDVIAPHFTPTWACSPDTSLAGRTICDWRNRIDKLLSHVTYGRTVMIDEMAPQERWPIEEFHAGLVMVFSEFLKTVPEPRREWFGAGSGRERGDTATPLRGR